MNFAKFLKTPFLTGHLWWLLLYLGSLNMQKNAQRVSWKSFEKYTKYPTKTLSWRTIICLKSYRWYIVHWKLNSFTKLCLHFLGVLKEPTLTSFLHDHMNVNISINPAFSFYTKTRISFFSKGKFQTNKFSSSHSDFKDVICFNQLYCFLQNLGWFLYGPFLYTVFLTMLKSDWIRGKGVEHQKRCQSKHLKEKALQR